MKIVRQPPLGRIAAFIDGFNVFHSLKQKDKPDLRNYWWLDYRALCQALLPQNLGLKLTDVCYCTAYAWHAPSRQASHQVSLTADPSGVCWVCAGGGPGKM